MSLVFLEEDEPSLDLLALFQANSHGDSLAVVSGSSSLTWFGGVVSVDVDSVHCLFVGLLLLSFVFDDEDDCLSDCCDVDVLFVAVGAVVGAMVCCPIESVGWSVCCSVGGSEVLERHLSA